MIAPELTRCILCGAEAERLPYGVRGWKYRCEGRCPDYAVSGTTYYFLEMEQVFPTDLRRKISDYLVGIEPNPDEYYVLTKEDIEKATGKKMPQ